MAQQRAACCCGAARNRSRIALCFCHSATSRPGRRSGSIPAARRRPRRVAWQFVSHGCHARGQRWSPRQSRLSSRRTDRKGWWHTGWRGGRRCRCRSSLPARGAAPGAGSPEQHSASHSPPTFCQRHTAWRERRRCQSPRPGSRGSQSRAWSGSHPRRSAPSGRAAAVPGRQSGCWMPRARAAGRRRPPMSPWSSGARCPGKRGPEEPSSAVRCSGWGAARR